MKFYEKAWFMWVMMVFFFPVGLFLLWKFSAYEKKTKGIITAAVLVLVVYSTTQDKSTVSPQQQQIVQTNKSGDESLLHKVTQPKPALFDVRNNSDISQIRHGQEVIISGQVIAGNGKKSGRDITTDFGASESQPFTIQDKNKNEITIVMGNPLPYSLYEKSITVKGIADKKASDPGIIDSYSATTSKRLKLAIVEAEIVK